MPFELQAPMPMVGENLLNLVGTRSIYPPPNSERERIVFLLTGCCVAVIDCIWPVIYICSLGQICQAYARMGVVQWIMLLSRTAH